MKRKSAFLGLIVVILSLNSCVTYEKYSMEVYKPALFTFPPEIRKVAVVARNLKYENDTLQNYFVRNNRLLKDKIRLNQDSLASKICLDSLAEQLHNQNRFDSILVMPVNHYPVIRVKEVRHEKAEWYQHLAGQTNADGLILLDMFSCFYTESTEYPSASANVITSNIWSVYNAQKQKITDRFVQIDTLYWDGTDEEGRYKKIHIPAKKEAISIAAGVIGKNYSKHLLPSWTLVYRDIMTCKNQEMMKAAKLAKKNKWEEASAIWQRYAKMNSKRYQIVALYNLALASEMSGDIDQAIQLTHQAAKLSTGAFRSIENEAVRKYSAVLYRRKIEINKLNQQNDSR